MFGGRAAASDDAIALLSGKWRAKILCVLETGPLRANQLLRAFHPISAKVLTETLRGMERDGLIERHQQRRPRRVQYALTPAGAAATSHVRALRRWAEALLPRSGSVLQR